MNTFETDHLGYLKNSQDWTEAIADQIAFQENIVLSSEHWVVIRTLRDFYLKHGVLPSMRSLIKLIGDQMTSDKNQSIYLQGLFPKGLMRQASKIAGLPKPVRCI